MLVSDLDFVALNNEHIFFMRWPQTRVKIVGAMGVSCEWYHQRKNTYGLGCGLVYN